MPSSYPMEVFWNHDAYVAIAPDLPGCSAIGDTPIDALRELLVVIPLWLQTAQEMDQPIPPPSTPGCGLETERRIGRWQGLQPPARLAAMPLS